MTYHDAGHILGSAHIEIAAEEGTRTKRIVFSGDIGNVDRPILEDPTLLNRADAVVMESTYGDRNHRSHHETRDELRSIVSAALDDGGNVLIPAFSLGRTQEVIYHLNALREAGVVIALDDFGTGFSSLNLLRNLPLDIIKIDRSFVVAIADSSISRELTKNIIQIARALEKVVVAEGAETHQQIALLREYGCDFIQGYGVSRALPLDAYIEFMIGYQKARQARAVREVHTGS